LEIFVEGDVTGVDLPDSNSVRACVEAVLHRCEPVRDQVAVQFVDEETMHEMNHRYRDKDAATNVLSFVFEDPPGKKTRILGDIVICPEVVHREADAQGKRSDAHFAHLVVHGALHLCGYDHEDAKDAREMETIETEILASLGFDDPY